MSERDIRETIRRACAQLDRLGRPAAGRRTRPSHLVWPAMLGAGLAVTTCGDEVETRGDGGGGQSTTNTGTASGIGGAPQPPYGAPGGWSGTGGDGGATGGAGGATGGAGGVGGEPAMEYMAPDSE